MPRKGPHISISYDRLVPRVLGISAQEFASWPEAVRELTRDVAAEMFLVRYNPFIDSELVRRSVKETLDKQLIILSHEYAQALTSGVNRFWASYDEDVAFRKEVIARLQAILPAESLVMSRASLIETSTDATDYRMELPMLMVSPETTKQIRDIVRLAGEMEFSIIPRGGGTGATGGAIPAKTRTVILSLSKMKRITDIDEENLTITAEAGVITLQAIEAAKEQGILFTVDPASKAGSSIGGNISENSGGPFAFEYGVTLDNILSYKMVNPSGQLLEVRRVDHPRRKILEGESVVFEILNESGTVIDTLRLSGDDIRGKGLGKDVSNKYMGGLPGVQKEGVDGIITEGTFTCYPLPKLSRVMCLEFFGRSMHNAMLVIKDIVAYRDTIREQGDLVKVSALEEFGPKYVQAIDYTRKSDQYDGDPISVLIVQLDSDHADALNQAVEDIMNIARPYENVDIFAAQDEREAELFWEDRHKLSAIAKRTSGFKINEDIVIPIDVIPEFSDFLENLNLRYLAKAYRRALTGVMDLPQLPPDEETVDSELDFLKTIFRGQLLAQEMNDQELEVRIAYFFKDLEKQYPAALDDLRSIEANMHATRVCAANHMHAGDGNNHVNFPANSNDPEMLAEVHEAVDEVFEKVMELGGAVTGEHGIGITKIGFLEDSKLAALKAYKAEIDPRGLINPGKLISRELTVEPYTFSFNRLIQDLKTTALPDKERLISLLEDIQTCTRCGKCKQVCPMYHPTADLMFHPRNKNLSLGALIEAIYYSLLHTGKPDPKLMKELRGIIDHCTACGRCMGVCPVKIDSSKVALNMRAFLEDKRAGGHPVKSNILHYLASKPENRIPFTAKLLSAGQKIQEPIMKALPDAWRERISNPAISGPNPELGYKNLSQTLGTRKSFILAPEDIRDSRDVPEAVFYFPGCGASLFSREIGMAAVYLLLKSEVSVIVPDEHLCCGYPLLASGMEKEYNDNFGHNLGVIKRVLDKAERKGFSISTVLTSCGTCRETLHRYGISGTFGNKVKHKDVTQYLHERGEYRSLQGEPVIYHAACHMEWTDQPLKKAREIYRSALAETINSEVLLSPECCGESGLGAMTSPAIYNKLRTRKREQLEKDLVTAGKSAPIIVGCPSCKVGIKRNLLDMEVQREVMHTIEYIARLVGGENWRKELEETVKAAPVEDSVRFVKNID